jgi:hypothetical protein
MIEKPLRGRDISSIVSKSHAEGTTLSPSRFLFSTRISSIENSRWPQLSFEAIHQPSETRFPATSWDLRHLRHHVLSHFNSITEHIHTKFIRRYAHDESKTLLRDTRPTIEGSNKIAAPPARKVVEESSLILVRIDPSPSSHLVATAEICTCHNFQGKNNTSQNVRLGLLSFAEKEIGKSPPSCDCRVERLSTRLSQSYKYLIDYGKTGIHDPKGCTRHCRKAQRL